MPTGTGLNLKTKSSLAVAVLLTVVFGAGMLVQDYLVENSLKQAIADQQLTLASRVADDIDTRLRISQRSLENIAAGLTPELIADPAAARAYIHDKPGILAIFDALILVGPDMIVLADAPPLPGRVGTDVSGLEHLQRLAATGRPVISEPFMGRVTQRPTLALSVPVNGTDGQLIAFLSGTLDLHSSDFLGSLGHQDRNSAGHFILTTRNRTTIVSTVPEQSLQTYAPPGVNPVYDQALEGWEGSVEGGKGARRMLMSFRSLETADWVLGAMLPADEAFAPIHASRRTAALLLLLSSALVGLLVWFAMRSFLRPLLQLRDNAVRLRANPELVATFKPGNDEIGELAGDFYRLVEDLSRSRRESMERAAELQSILDASPIAIALIQDRRVTRANPAYLRMFGYSLDEVLGSSVAQFYLSQEDYEETGRRIYAGIADGSVVRIEQRLRDRSGRVFWANLYCRLLDPEHPEKGPVTLIEDISERKANEERIRYLAEHDALTGLPNRVLFHDRLSQAIVKARRDGHRIALIFLDIDRFKNINDSLGHHVGDQLLQSVAARIQQCVRASDTVSRPGGDEFGILLPDIADIEDAARVSLKLLESLARPYSVDERQLTITASIGITIYPDDGDDIPALMRNADTAMYHSKDSGRNAYHYFRSEMNERVLERMSLENALRQGLDNEEFRLHYQPQIDIRTRRIIGMEALIRWHNQVSGQISPARFIPVAEDTGLILPIGDWVLREACRQNRAWQDAGLPAAPVAVNISALQFRQPQFVATLQTVLEASRLAPDCLDLELTESIMMQAVDRNIGVLETIRAMGVKVSIDDFGTGYSSLSYLKRLPIDKLKIDQAFVRDIATDPDDAVLIAAIIGLARNMKLDVIAEGVETEAQLEFLERSGCEQIQGYLISTPLPADAFEALWRDSLKSPGGAIGNR